MGIPSYQSNNVPEAGKLIVDGISFLTFSSNNTSISAEKHEWPMSISCRIHHGLRDFIAGWSVIDFFRVWLTISFSFVCSQTKCSQFIISPCHFCTPDFSELFLVLVCADFEWFGLSFMQRRRSYHCFHYFTLAWHFFVFPLPPNLTDYS